MPSRHNRKSARLRPAASRTTARRSGICSQYERCSKSCRGVLDRLQFDEQGRTRGAALRELAHLELDIAAGAVGAKGHELVAAAIEEGVETAVTLAGLSGHLAGAGHAVHHLEGGAGGARGEDGVAPEPRDGQHRGLAPGRREHRGFDHRGAGRAGRRAPGETDEQERRLHGHPRETAGRQCEGGLTECQGWRKPVGR